MLYGNVVQSFPVDERFFEIFFLTYKLRIALHNGFQDHLKGVEGMRLSICD